MRIASAPGEDGSIAVQPAGALSTASPPRADAFLEALQSADAARRLGAIRALRDNGRSEDLVAAAAQLFALTPEIQSQIIPLFFVELLALIVIAFFPVTVIGLPRLFGF